ncbi:preprotein translocase subunit SecE [Dokdonella koreensis]|uniref:Protein translocase subunit SecE n=1 Tax=Dokdonella koreensis DS-123 TaxID=1300342 RepID=A0A167H2S7_9GAMM|nr:preprotein translocase subunit SecE [Dokdonella koreensis]ANB18642.1 Preprotein translocase subunit SecE [Dokdonella koreensis DS-123]
MNAKVEQHSGAGAVEIAKLALAAVLAVAGIVGYYYYAGTLGSLPRLGILVGAFVLALLIAAFTRTGRSAREFLGESQFELRKVVWPTRDETLKTTGVIIVVVIILSLLLGLMDLILKWIVLDWLLKLGH